MELTTKGAGVLSLCLGDHAVIHLLPWRRSFWCWGLRREWAFYDGPFDAFGLGPLLLVVWVGKWR